MKINLSPREKKLVYLLAALVVVFIAYKFIFLPTITNYNIAFDEYSRNLSEENQLKANIINNEDMKKKIEDLKDENRELSIKLPPELHQENILMDMIEIFKNHNIELLSMNFEDENRLEEKKVVQSIDDALELYEESMNVNSQKMGSLSDIIKGKGTEEEEEPEKTDETDDIKYMMLSISCEGKYADIKSLLLDITETRNIVITKNITLGKDSESLDKLICSLEFNFPYYEDNSKEEIPIWEDTNNIDKDIEPFNYYVPGSQLDPNIAKLQNTLQNGILSNYEPPVKTVVPGTEEDDFYAILKPKESDNFAFTIGKSGERISALHSDLNNESLQFIFEKEGDSYYYSIGNNLRPIDSEYVPGAFSPNSSKIIISVQSQPRLGADDTAKATMNIINRTDLPVEVQVKNDDSIYPRIIVRAKEGNVKVKNF